MENGSVMFGSPRPAWSGMMQLVHQGKHPGKSSVMFLPMIDMNPSDISCVYSTLKYIESHARRYCVTPIVPWEALFSKAPPVVYFRYTMESHMISCGITRYSTVYHVISCGISDIPREVT